MLPSRPLRITAAVGALVLAYGAGAATIALTSGPAASPREHSVLDQAEQQIMTQAAHRVAPARLERAAVEGMLRALDDRWSAYYGPKDFTQFQDVLAGRYTGIGIWVRRTTDGTLRVMSVQPGSPAARAGLRPHDVLMRIGTHPVTGVPVADVVSELRGAAGTTVTLRVRRGARVITATLRRAPVNDDDVNATTVAPGVEQLQIAAFTRGVGRWVRDQVALARSHHVEGLILDLRDNPGGLLDEAVETASAFLDGGPVVSYQQHGSAPRVLNALGHGDTGIPLVVLVDGGTASAAEIVAAALQDRGRAVLLGTRTFGKGTVQAPSRLSDGSALELTVGRYLTPSGRSLEGTGVEPDVQVPVGTPDGVVVQRAVEVLSGLTADAGSTSRG